jgi:transposase
MPERFVDIDRRTPMLLPVDLRDWAAHDGVMLLIVDAVEQCDLRRAVTNDRGSGSPQYPPGMMVSLLIYAYAHGVFSSRRIEQLTYENLSVRYLCANTHPDHDTIAKFRRENGALFQDCMRAIILLGRELGMVKLGMLAVDGTRLQANANRHRFTSQKQLEQEQVRVDELIKDLLQKAETADQAPQGEEESEELPPELADEQKRQQAIKAALERIKQREAEQKEQKEQLAQRGRKSNAGPVRMNLTDPDCGILHRKGAGTVVGFNAQIAVDVQGAGLIISNTVSAQGCDAELLHEVLEPIEGHFGQAAQEVIVDTGYESAQRAYEIEKSLGTKVIYSPRPTQVAKSPVEKKHTRTQRLVRHVRHLIKKRAESAHGQWLRHRRQTVAEGALGFIRRTLGFERFNLRGLKKVQTEWQLVCLAFNIRKLA